MRPGYGLALSGVYSDFENWVVGKGASGTERITLPNWVEVLSRQKAEARTLFGSTSVNMPGRTDIQYPALNGNYLKRLITYWQSELASVDAKVQSDETFKRFTPSEYERIATRDAWNREYSNYKWNLTLLAPLTYLGDRLIPNANAVTYWQTLETCVLRGSSIAGTPTQWEFFKWATAEAAREFMDKVSEYTPTLIPNWVKWALYGTAGLGLIWLLQPYINRGRRY